MTRGWQRVSVAAWLTCKSGSKRYALPTPQRTQPINMRLATHVDYVNARTCGLSCDHGPCRTGHGPSESPRRDPGYYIRLHTARALSPKKSKAHTDDGCRYNGAAHRWLIRGPANRRAPSANLQSVQPQKALDRVRHHKTWPQTEMPEMHSQAGNQESCQWPRSNTFFKALTTAPPPNMACRSLRRTGCGKTRSSSRYPC